VFAQRPAGDIGIGGHFRFVCAPAVKPHGSSSRGEAKVFLLLFLQKKKNPLFLNKQKQKDFYCLQ
jgi:hypothetical protein